jgi:hypothetical protein
MDTRFYLGVAASEPSPFRKILKICLITIGCAFLANCATHANRGSDSAVKEQWNAKNDPGRFNVAPAKFEELAKEGMLPQESYPWSDDYWVTYAGGVARRWQTPVQSPKYKAHMYPYLKKAEIIDPAADLSKLSPAEKYDILLGRYDFPLTTWQWKQVVDTAGTKDAIPGWFGICHGWAPATIMEPEPGEVVELTNPDGVKVKFYTSDINALMSLIYANFGGGSTMLGERCNVTSNKIVLDENGRVVFTKCRDTNPGALHLVMASMLGKTDPLQRKGFVADVTRDSEVWNQAVTGYKVISSEIVPFVAETDTAAAYRAPGTASLVHVKAKMFYIGEITPHKSPRKTNFAGYTKAMDLEYTLELDAEGVIIGGEWISKDVPDFIWQMGTKPDTGTSYLSYKKVREILDQSLLRTGDLGTSSSSSINQ